MKTEQRSNGFIEIRCSDPAKALHRKNTDTYISNGRAIISSDCVADWEETDMPKYTPREYATCVAELIHQLYDIDAETALINNMLDNPDDERKAEYAAYQAYRSQCKARARRLLESGEWQRSNAAEGVQTTR